MKPNRRHTAVLCAALAGALIGGCASRPTEHIVFTGSMQPSQTTVASLGAGDSIGRAVYANDVVLARTQARDGRILATVNDDEDN